MDIVDTKRGNPIKVVFEILKDTNIMLNSVKSGTLISVIPRECEVIFSINNYDSIKAIQQNIKSMQNRYKSENIELEKNENKSIVISEIDSKKVVNCINDFINGAINKDSNGNALVGAIAYKTNLTKPKFSSKI